MCYNYFIQVVWVGLPVHIFNISALSLSPLCFATSFCLLCPCDTFNLHPFFLVCISCHALLLLVFFFKSLLLVSKHRSNWHVWRATLLPKWRATLFLSTLPLLLVLSFPVYLPLSPLPTPFGICNVLNRLVLRVISHFPLFIVITCYLHLLCPCIFSATPTSFHKKHHQVALWTCSPLYVFCPFHW